MMTFKTKYGEYPNCEFVTGYYPNGNLALQVAIKDEGSLCTCTVNPGQVVTHDAIAVKDYSENEGMVETLTTMGIIGKELYRIPRGRVGIPVHKLTKKGLKIFGLELFKVDA